MFQFYFDDEGEADRILKGSPWMFQNSWLILKKWTQKIGHKIGAFLGEVKEFEVYENRERGTFVRLLVEINNQKPLITGIPVGSKMDGVTWVDFRYEKLTQFCYQCGCIGHDEDMCKSISFGPLGEHHEDKLFGP
ncbi:Zinc knuckle CX2CX4HX4C [Sesbania bispinosa]|nr:Zinc knuckle CX2CX4HX4C [Sesbania bispinosa]